MLRARFAKSSRDSDVTVNQLAVLSAEDPPLEEAIAWVGRVVDAAGQPPQRCRGSIARSPDTGWHGAKPRGNADAELRDHLLASAVDFRQLMSSTLEGYRIENGETVWQHLSHRVDALLDGKELTFSRYELPDWHPESTVYGGNPADNFELGPDDVLRPYESTESMPPNRGWANGWRGSSSG